MGGHYENNEKNKLITVMIMVTTLLLCSCTQHSSDMKTSKTKSSKNTVSSRTQHPVETKASKNTDAYNIFTEDYNNISKKISYG